MLAACKPAKIDETWLVVSSESAAEKRAHLAEANTTKVPMYGEDLVNYQNPQKQESRFMSAALNL